MSEDHDFAPVSDADWPEALADMRAGFAGGLNVYRTMAHHPALLRAWGPLREHVVNRSALGRQRLEVVILRCGFRLGSDYEWSQHVIRARRCGLSEPRILSLRGPLSDMEGEDRVLAGAVDELFADRALRRSTQAALASLVGKEGILDLIATLGFYSTLGYLLNSFRTPLDDEIRRELSARPVGVGPA
jgi:4-carboxymuconolactone decarboxylase